MAEKTEKITKLGKIIEVKQTMWDMEAIREYIKQHASSEDVEWIIDIAEQAHDLGYENI